MKNIWYNQNYITWQLDLSKFENKQSFDDELEKKLYLSSLKPFPPESNGNAYSTDIYDITYFNNLYTLMYNEVNNKLDKLYNEQIKSLRRVWANRMHKGSFGSCHVHGSNLKVTILYYNIPDQSSDLIIVNPKYKLFNVLDPRKIPEVDRFHIKVQDGLCVLHGGEVLHAVSEHMSEKPRDCIIFEFETVNKE